MSQDFASWFNEIDDSIHASHFKHMKMHEESIRAIMGSRSLMQKVFLNIRICN